MRANCPLRTRSCPGAGSRGWRRGSLRSTIRPHCPTESFQARAAVRRCPAAARTESAHGAPGWDAASWWSVRPVRRLPRLREWPISARSEPLIRRPPSVPPRRAFWAARVSRSQSSFRLSRAPAVVRAGVAGALGGGVKGSALSACSAARDDALPSVEPRCRWARACSSSRSTAVFSYSCRHPSCSRT